MPEAMPFGLHVAYASIVIVRWFACLIQSIPSSALRFHRETAYVVVRTLSHFRFVPARTALEPSLEVTMSLPPLR